MFVADRAMAAGQPDGAAGSAWPSVASAPDWSQLGPIVEARLAIEPFVAALAARRRTQQQLHGLVDQLTRFDTAAAAGDRRSMVMADLTFHGAIAEIGNPVLAHTLRELGVLLITSRYISLARTARSEIVARRHRSIYAAIEDGDANLASEAMVAHLTDFVHELGYQTVSSGRGTSLLEIEMPASLQRTLEEIWWTRTGRPPPPGRARAAPRCAPERLTLGGQTSVEVRY